jgi:hypothetical protein
MKFEHQSSTSNVVRLFLENDEMHDFRNDMFEAVCNSQEPAPVLYTFITDNWIVGKSFEISSCSIKYLVELVDYLEHNQTWDGYISPTTKVLVELTKHAQKRIANINFFEELMETI